MRRLLTLLLLSLSATVFGQEYSKNPFKWDLFNGLQVGDTLRLSSFIGSNDAVLIARSDGSVDTITAGSLGLDSAQVLAVVRNNVDTSGTYTNADAITAVRSVIDTSGTQTLQQTLDLGVNGDSIRIDSVIQMKAGAMIKFSEVDPREKEWEIVLDSANNRLNIGTPSKDYFFTGNEFFGVPNANIGTESNPWDNVYGEVYRGDAYYVNKVNINTVSGDTINTFGKKYVRESSETLNDTIYLRGFTGTFINSKFLIENNGGGGSIFLCGGTPNAALNVQINGDTNCYEIKSGYQVIEVVLTSNDSYSVFVSEDPQTFAGWAQYTDTTYTTSNRLVVTAGDTITLPNDAGSVIDEYLPVGVMSLYNATDTLITPENVGDSYEIRVDFKAEKVTAVDAFAGLQLDIGGSQGVIVERLYTFPKGTNEHSFSTTTSIYSLSTFISNGGKLKFFASGSNVEIWDINYVIVRTSKGF